MIKVNNNDSIIDVIQKIGEEHKNEVIIEFPFGHPILHNYLSLKIIKNKAGTKPLTIITKDITARKIGKKLGINFSIIKDDSFIEYSHKAQIINHNLTFFEYFKYEVKNYIKKTINFFTRNEKIDEFRKYSTKYYQKSGVGFFLLSLLLSVLVFFIVLFFAINKTYIYIKPEINIKTVAHNFIFKDIGDKEDLFLDDKIVKIKKISKIINLDEQFQTTGINPLKSKKSKGSVIFFNNYAEEMYLKPNTRIESKDGLIFEISEAIKIPAGSIDSNGKLSPGIYKTEVNAKDYDINGKYIGVRGNSVKIKDKFTLPGLKDDDKDKIYAEAASNFSGGDNSYERVLGEDDIKNAKVIFEDKLRREALKELKTYLDQENSLNNVTYDLLSYGDILKDIKFDIETPKDIKVGDKIESYILKGSISFSSYIYNKNSVLSKLKSIINEKIIPETQNLLSIDDKSVRVTNLLYENTYPRLEVKLTLEIDSLVSQNFLNKNSWYVLKLKNLILGLDKKEAEKILLNDKNIRSADIEIQPFFMNKISNIPDNVVFKIED
nr:hypothetical protein [Candidatus Gracilibacteria bacterium]